MTILDIDIFIEFIYSTSFSYFFFKLKKLIFYADITKLIILNVQKEHTHVTTIIHDR